MRGIVAEELGRVDLSLAFTLVPSYGTSLAVLHSGTKEQKEEWIPGLIKGEKLGSVSMTEPDCGSDLSAIRTKAKRVGAYYLLNGEKSYVSWGTVADVNWIFVKTERDTKPRDVTAFLIPLDLPGIVKSFFSQMGLYTAGHTSLALEDVLVPVEYRLGEEGKAFVCASEVFPHTRMILSLSALGLAQTSLEEAIDFAKQRIACSKHPGKFEAISFKIAEDATQIEAARWLCYRTLRLVDQGRRCVKKIAMCKWWSTEVALCTIHNALLTHGHRGYSTQYSLEQRYRDIIGYEIAESTAQILKLTICEEILDKKFRPF
jgi:cyclohexanecarboxyl-CoA dehydrogenase